MLRKGDTGDWIGTFEGHKGAVWGVVLNSDASLAATGSADFTAKIWNTTQGDEVFSLPHKHIVKSVDFSSDDNQLLTSSNDKIIRLFDLNNINSGKIFFIIKILSIRNHHRFFHYLIDPQNFIGHDDNIRQALFSNIEGTQFVSCADDKTIRFWDKRSTKECFKLTFDQKPNGIEVTNDKSILSICYDQNVIFFDLSRMVQIKKFQAPTVIETSSLHPDKNVFVCGGLDFLIYKCDYNRCETIGKWIFVINQNHFYYNFFLFKKKSQILILDILVPYIVYDIHRMVNYMQVVVKMVHYVYGKIPLEKLMAYGNMLIVMKRNKPKTKTDQLAFNCKSNVFPR